MWRFVICGALCVTLMACSTTPGDAALRGGHFAQAAALYEEGAKHGDAQAAERLGDLYNYRPGLPEDHQKAIYWYNKAIDLGNPVPCWAVGVIYRDGKGNVPKNLGLAEQYFLQGSEKGQHYSMYDLSGMYADNLTKTSNDIEGLKWLEVVTAFASTCPKSNEGCQYILRDPQKIKEKFESRMSPNQKQQAKALAEVWLHDWKQKNN